MDTRKLIESYKNSKTTIPQIDSPSKVNSRTILKAFESGLITPTTKLSGNDINKWNKQVETISNKAYNYLSNTGYKKADPELLKSIEGLLAQSDDVRQYILYNRPRINDYQTVYDGFRTTEDYLKKLRDTVRDSNDYFSTFPDAKTYEESAKYLDTMQNTDTTKLAEEIKGLEAQSAMADEAIGTMEKLWVGATREDGGISENYRETSMFNTIYNEMLGQGHSEKEAYRLAEEEFQTRYAELNSKKGQGLAGYKTLDELNADISSKKKTLKEVTNYQEVMKLSKAAEDSTDFNKFSLKGAKTKEATDENGKKHKNKLLEAKENNESFFYVGGGMDYGQSKFTYKLFTEDEKKVYNYYFGKGDFETADRYWKVMKKSLNERYGKAIFNSIEGTPAEYLYFVPAGLDQFTTGIKNVFNFSDEYVPASSIAVGSSLVREDLGKKHGTLGTTLYDIGTTTVNMIPSIATGAAVGAAVGTVNPALGAKISAVTTATLMGASAKGNAYVEKINAGWSVAEAQKYSTIVGVSEACLQYVLNGVSVGAGALTKRVTQNALNGIKNGFLKGLAKLGISMCSEAIEEGLQEIFDPFYENFALGYAENGIEDIDWEQVAYSAVLGGLSGALFEGVGTAANTVKLNMQYGRVYSPYAQEVVNGAREATKGGDGLVIVKKAQETLDSGKKLSGNTLRKLIVATNEGIAQSNVAKLSPVVSEQLMAHGEQGDVAAMTDIISRASQGLETKSSELKAIENSHAARTVFADIVKNETWVKDLGLQKASDLSYNQKIYGNKNTSTKAVDTETSAEGQTVPTVEGEDTAEAETVATETETPTDSIAHPAPTAGKVLKMTPVSAKAKNYVKDIAKRLGTNLEFVDMAAELAKRGQNIEGLVIYPEGFYDPETHTLYVGNEVSNPVEFVFKHELTHYGERSKYYAAFARAVRNSKAFKKWLDTQATYTAKDTAGKELQLHLILKERYKGVKNLTEPDAQREVVANFVADVLFKGDVETLSEILNEATPTQKNAVMRFLSDFFNWIKSKFTGSKQIVSEIADLENKFRELIGDAAVNPMPTESGITYDTAETEANKSMSVAEANTDSTGAELSKGQRKYFALSKVRDAYGRLIRLFHGTDNGGFTEFDPSYSDDGTTIFTTDNRAIAESYIKSHQTGDIELNAERPKGLRWTETGKSKPKGRAGVYTVYANLKNPLVIKGRGRNWNRLTLSNSNTTNDVSISITGTKGNYEMTIKNGEFAVGETTYTAENVGQLWGYVAETFNREAADTFRKNFETYLNGEGNNRNQRTDVMNLLSLSGEQRIGFSEAFSWDYSKGVREEYLTTRDLGAYAKKNGYDGVIIKNITDSGGQTKGNPKGTIVIAFEANQIKAVSNENPTKSKDIRYSVPASEGAVNEKTAEEVGGNLSFSYPGEKSRTANLSLLTEAKDMDANGKGTDVILKKTGWFKGGDGKWRYMISDKEMQFYPNGHFSNPDVTRYRELQYKYITDTENMTEEEISEMRSLSKNLVGVKTSPTFLDQYISHTELFSAYPQLKNVRLRFDKLKGGKYGVYYSDKNEIVISSSIREDVEKVKDTLIHEIQHAIQHIESFANGGNFNIGKRIVFNFVFNKVKDTPAYKALSSSDERVNFVNNEAAKLFGAENIEEAGRKTYFALYGEVEAREVSKNRNKTLDELKEIMPDTRGKIYDASKTNQEYVEILKEIGYTEKQINTEFEGDYYDQSGSERITQTRVGQTQVGGQTSDKTTRARSDSVRGNRGESRNEPSDLGRGVRSNVSNGRGGNENDLTFSVPASEGEAQTNYKAELGRLLQRLQNEEITQEEYMSEVSKLYQKSVDENGQIKQGEMVTPENKPYPVPKKVKEGTAVRGFVRTVMETGKATPEIASHFEQLILSGEFDHTPTSNEKRINAAVQKINSLGYQQALDNWYKTNDKLLTSDKNNIAVGEALLNLAFEHKNVADIMNLTAELAEIGTRTAQDLQAMKLLKRMGGIAQLVYVQKAVAKINENLEKRFSGRFERRGIPVPVVKINETMANQLAECSTESEYEVVYEAIMQDIANQVPSTFLDQFTAWRYMSMLFSTTTHIRNFLGNAIFLPMVRMKNVIGKAIELTRPKDQRTKSVAVKKAYKDFAEKDFAEVKDLISGSGKYNPSDQINEYRKIFKIRWLEALRKFNFKALEKEDAFFLKRHYRHSLGGYLQAQGIDLNNISQKQLRKARDYAIQEALKATYRDTNKVANVLSQLSHTSVLGNVLIEGVMPFKKTPLNIVKRGIEYSPAGLLKTTLDGIRLLRGGTITASEWVDGLASNLTGIGVFLLGFWLSSMGIVKAGFDDEDEQFRKMNGEQEYSIEILGHSYTMSWAAPMCIPFFMGSAMEEYDPDEDGDLLSAIGDIALSGFEPVLELSCLSGINDAIQGVKYAAEGEIPGLVMHSVKSFASQLLPTSLGKVANLFDDTRRTTYIDKTSDIPELAQEALDKLASKFPGATYTRAEYIDAWGREKYTGNFIERFFQQFVSPGYASTVDESKISDELRRIYKATDESGVYPDTPKKTVKIGGVDRHLSKEEYYKVATMAGQTKMNLVNEAMDHKFYDKLTDEQKTEVIKNIYKYANSLAITSELDFTLDEIKAGLGDKKGSVLTESRWNGFSFEQQQYLIHEAFMDGVITAYKYEQNGGSAAEYFILKALRDK